MRVALESAGTECVFSSDWDKYAQQTYAANFGHTPEGNIREIQAADIPDHDILVGGFPCQPFSMSGVSKKNSLGREHRFKDDERHPAQAPLQPLFAAIELAGQRGIFAQRKLPLWRGGIGHGTSSS
jgi:site-specific DNA-cytosine methylase